MAKARLTLLGPAHALALRQQAVPAGTLVLGPPADRAAVLLGLAGALRGETGPAGSALEVYPAGENLSGHVVVTLDALGQAVPADCRVAAHAAGVLGVTTGAVMAASPATIRAAGLLESPGWGLTPDQPIYLGEAGALVQSIAPSALFIKPIGRAVSATAVLIDLQPAIFLT